MDRVGIIGSRRFKLKGSIKSLVKSLPKTSTVVSGGCKGVDTWAESAAKDRGLDTLIFLPLLPPKGSPRYEFTKAYYARNKLIVENSDIIHAFVSIDRIGGTENTIKHAKKLNIPVVIHYQ